MADKKIFISYNHSDQQFVHPICEILESDGFPIWLDQNEMMPGDWLSDEINLALTESGAFIAFVGDQYFSNGRYTSQEVRAAEGLALSNPAWRLILVKLTPNAAIPPMMRDRLRVEYQNAEQTASELSKTFSRHRIIDASEERSVQPLSFDDLSDLDLRLILNGYLDQRHSNLRKSSEMIKFDIRLGGGRRVVFDVMREIAMDEGVRGELQHQHDILKVKQRAVEIARKTLTRGLAGQFQAGFEVMMEEDFEKIADVHSILKRHLSGICERLTLCL